MWTVILTDSDAPDAQIDVLVQRDFDIGTSNLALRDRLDVSIGWDRQKVAA